MLILDFFGDFSDKNGIAYNETYSLFHNRLIKGKFCKIFKDFIDFPKDLS